MNLIILAIIVVVAAAALVAVIYNHKSIAKDVAAADAVATKLDATVAPAVQAAKPIVAQSIAEVDAQVAAAVANKPAE